MDPKDVMQCAGHVVIPMICFCLFITFLPFDWSVEVSTVLVSLTLTGLMMTLPAIFQWWKWLQKYRNAIFVASCVQKQHWFSKL